VTTIANENGYKVVLSSDSQDLCGGGIGGLAWIATFFIEYSAFTKTRQVWAVDRPHPPHTDPSGFAMQSKQRSVSMVAVAPFRLDTPRARPRGAARCLRWPKRRHARMPLDE
jgi:hypothetical protein